MDFLDAISSFRIGIKWDAKVASFVVNPRFFGGFGLGESALAIVGEINAADTPRMLNPTTKAIVLGLISTRRIPRRFGPT